MKNVTIMNGLGKISVTLLVACSLCIQAAMAADKIAYVDAARVLEELPHRVDLENQLKATYEKRGETINAKWKAFEQKVAKFRKDSVSLPKDKRQAQDKALQEEGRVLAKERLEFEEALKRSRFEGLESMEVLVSEVIEEIAKKEKIDIVLQQPVVYFSERIDITDDVLKKLKARHK